MRRQGKFLIIRNIDLATWRTGLTPLGSRGLANERFYPGVDNHREATAGRVRMQSLGRDDVFGIGRPTVIRSLYRRR